MQNYKFRKNKHNNITKSAASCNSHQVTIIYCLKCTIAFYSVRARVYKKTECCDLVSF